MLKIFNSLLVITLLVSAFVVYSLEYSIKQGERDVVRIKRETRQVRETIHLLDAEWSMLTHPARLQRLAKQYLKLQPVKAEQIMPLKTLLAKLPERPAPDPSKTEDDPIARMLAEMPSKIMAGKQEGLN